VILADTGVLLAAANERDAANKACSTLVRDNAGALLVSPLVIAEVCYMLASRRGPDFEASFLESLCHGTLTLAPLTVADVARMAVLVRRYADLPLGAADASVVALAERLNIVDVATLDRRHFTVVRPRHCEVLTIMPG
jgi:predicted nucleic acid-binding protein